MERRRWARRLARLTLASVAVLAACGSDPQADQPAPSQATSSSIAAAPTPSTESLATVQVPESTLATSTTTAATTPDTTVPSTGATARAALLPLLGGSAGSTCPVASDVELLADSQVSWSTQAIDVHSDEQSVECVIRSAEGPPASLAVRVTIDVAGVEAYLSDDSLFMASADPYPREDGDLWVRCPREPTVGDTPQTCEAYWIASDGQLAIVASLSAPAVTLEEADYFGRRAVPKAVDWLIRKP